MDSNNKDNYQINDAAILSLINTVNRQKELIATQAQLINALLKDCIEYRPLKES